MRVLFLMLFACSCSLMFGSGSPPSAKGKQYKIQFAENGWKQMKKDERSDYVYENDDGRILLSNSFCNEFQEDPLDHLANKTFRAIGDFKAEKSAFTTFMNREAYRLEGKGKVDGVPVALQMMNTRRNNCYFDFVAIIPQKLMGQDKAFFDRFLSSVEFK
ncbi:MAG: hypothetical protein ACJ76H_05675 [Bacteriovoracaceae bacterium]